MENIKNWEKEFDRKFKHVYHPNIQAENIIQDTTEIKSFISSLLSTAINTREEEIVDMLGEVRLANECHDCSSVHKALDDIINKLMK